jgi:translation initiation factor 5
MSHIADVLKYYGCELGAQTNFEAKTGTCIVNGSHDNKKASEAIVKLRSRTVNSMQTLN